MKPAGLTVLVAAALLAGSTAAVASGPIAAPAPTPGDGPSFQEYAASWTIYQERWVRRLGAALVRWRSTDVGSPGERSALRQYTTSARRLRSGLRAFKRDLASTGFGANCKRPFIRSEERAFRSWTLVIRALSDHNFEAVNVRWDQGLTELRDARGRAYKMARCLDRRGWQTAPTAAGNPESTFNIADAFYLLPNSRVPA